MTGKSGLSQSGRDVNVSKSTTLDSAPGLSVGQVLRMLAKHIWFIVGCTAVCGLVAYLYAKSLTPIFEATASMRIDEGRARSLGLGDLVAAGGLDYLPTEIEILQSDQIAIATLNSLPDDVFQQYAGGDKQSLLFPANREVVTPAQEGLIGDFKGALGVKQVGETQLVDITFRDPNPRLAATIVNRVVAVYLRQSFESRHGSVAQVSSWLSSQMQDLKTRAADAQDKLSQFEEQNNILGTDGSGPTLGATTTSDRLRMLNDRLAGAEADRIVKEAQMRAAAIGTQDPAVVASVIPNARLQALQADQVTLYAQYAQLSTKFGANYAPLVQLKKQMQAVDAEIARTVQEVQGQLREEFDAAKTTEDMLRRDYDQQTQKAYLLNRQQAQLAVLQAEGAASRELYNTLQVKLEQAGVTAGLSGIDTLPVDTARAPLVPVEPKKSTILAFGTALGLLIGIGTAFLVEASADKVVSFDQLQGATGYRALVMVPRGPTSRAGTTSSPSMISLEEPLSRPAEAYRTLRSLLLPSVLGQEIKTVMVTSSQTGEGKSTVAANYAIVLAQTGARVLLVDAELRRPSLDSVFAVTNQSGLSEALESGNEPYLQQALPTLPNLFLLTAGKTPALPAEALSSERFRALLAGWKQQFDFIVVKASPLLAVSDSLPLASWSDGVLFIARQGVTRLKYPQNARALLNQTDANVIGSVITDATGASELSSDDEAYGKAAYAS